MRATQRRRHCLRSAFAAVLSLATVASAWSPPPRPPQHTTTTTTTTTRTTASCSRRTRLYYFDDCERLDEVDIDAALLSSTQWITTLSEEKRLAMDRLLGYNVQSASQLTDAAIEEETLRWAVDTNVVWAGEEEEEEEEENYDENIVPSSIRYRKASSKYERIQDLLVASDCHTTIDSLVFLWGVIADALDPMVRDGESSTEPLSSPGGAQFVVFPQAEPLWDYDQMVTMLQSVEITKPLLPAEYNLRLDLFHPDFKHSPRMWSQETHSPFPTVGISVTERQPSSLFISSLMLNTHDVDDSVADALQGTSRKPPVIDMEATRAKLNALFKSVDAETPTMASNNSVKKSSQVLQEAQSWSQQALQRQGDASNDANMKWVVEMHTGPVQLYKTLWKSIQSLVSSSSVVPHRQSAMVVVPLLDAHTLHRVAVTVNAALKKFDIPICITHMHHPHHAANEPAAPYGMIQLSSAQET